MVKKILIVLLFVLIFVMLAVFAYFYYIKPQREYIAINKEDCINKAMAPINSEIVKNSSNPYISGQGFSSMQKVQTSAINNCLEEYDTILFSGPEKNLFVLSVNSKIEKQSSGISIYLQKIFDKQAAAAAESARQQAVQQQKQARQNACANMKAEQEKQTACMQEAWPKPGLSIEAEKLAYSQLDAKQEACKQKYNPDKFGVTMYDCVMGDIFNF